MKNRLFRFAPASFVACLLLVTGCKVSIGHGDFGDGGIDFGDADVNPTGGAMSGDAAAGTGGSNDLADASVVAMDSSVGTDASTVAGTVAEVPAALASALCDAREACMGPGRLAALYDGNTCATVIERELADGPMSQLESSVAADLILYDDSVLAACLTAVRSLGCAVLESRLPSSCRETLLGLVSLGDDCNTDYDCEGDAYCDFGSPQPSCPGVCTARGAADASCTGDNQCQDGLLCTPAGSCQAPVTKDGACDGDTLVCDLQDICVSSTGTCKSQDDVYAALEDDPCTPNTGTLCLADLSQGISLVCSRDTMTCIPVSASNESCVPGSLPDACPVEQYCHPTSSTCVLRETAGNSCSSATSVAKQCAAGHVCLNDSCVRIGRLGDSCDDDAACYSDHCNLVLGQCEAPVVCQ